MPNSIEIELGSSTKKFISVGNQTFLNSKGQTEVCRKGLKGQHCQRHHGGAITSFSNARAQLDEYAERTAQKLSPFENGCVWLYSLLMRIPIEEARQRYINSTAMYTLIGVRKPHESEVKGLQKILLKLADISQVTSTRMDNLKRLIKKMTVGNGFSEAGFYSLKDMVKDSTMKLKLGVAGTTLGGTLFLTGCSGNPISDTVATFSYDNKKVDNQTGNDQLMFFEESSDEYGSYTRTYVELPKDFKLSNGEELTEETYNVLNTALKFTSLEAIDSITLDSPNRWEEWKTNVAPQYLHSQYIGEILQSSEAPAVGMPTGVIFRDTNSEMPRLIRDGGVRVADKRFSDITIQSDNNGTYYVAMSGSALVYSNDDIAKPWWTEKDKAVFFERDIYNADGSIMTPEQKNNEWQKIEATAQQDTIPDAYKDDKMNSTLMYFNVYYTMIKEGNEWKIAGYSNTFTHNPADAQSGNSQQLDYRSKIKK